MATTTTTTRDFFWISRLESSTHLTQVNLSLEQGSCLPARPGKLLVDVCCRRPQPLIIAVYLVVSSAWATGVKLSIKHKSIKQNQRERKEKKRMIK